MLGNLALEEAHRYRLICRRADNLTIAYAYVTAIVALQAFDLLLTLIGLSSGHVEGNPISLSILLNAGVPGAIVEKVVVTILMIGVVLRMRRGQYAVMALAVGVCLFTVGHNTLMLT